MYVDRYRFPEGLEAAQRSALGDLVADFGKKWARIKVLLQQRAKLREGYAALEDDESRKIFRDILTARCLTPHFSRLANNKAMYDELEAFMTEPLGTADEQASAGMDDGETVWKLDYKGTPLEITSIKYGLYWFLKSSQYYFARGGVRVAPEPGDVIFDCGSFIGDTAMKFAVDVGENGRVYSFDPFPQHVELEREMIARNGFAGRVEATCSGVTSRSGIGDRPVLSRAAPEGQVEFAPGRPLMPGDDAISIDEFCETKGLDHVDYIKMDIEGSERAALEGAHETILRCKPKLAVCVYHRLSDLWTIPMRLKKRYPFYRLFLEHHSLHFEETVLYAIAK